MSFKLESTGSVQFRVIIPFPGVMVPQVIGEGGVVSGGLTAGFGVAVRVWEVVLPTACNVKR
jgi:hypothetical protein